MFIKSAYAAISNPALQNFGTDTTGGAGLAFYVSQLWKTLVVVGGLAFLLYTIIGGINWVIAGGDKTKVESAQKHLTNGLTGLIVLAASYAIMAVISDVVGINILNIDWTFGN